MAERRATGPSSQYINLGLDVTREEIVDAIFEAAKNDASGNPRTLPVGGSQLLTLCSREYQSKICYKTGHDVQHIPGRMTKEQWLSTDPVYVDGLLIQSRGLPLIEACTCCLRNLGPFSECVRLPGLYGGICGNCRYTKRDSECTLRWNGGGNRATFERNPLIAIQPFSDSEISYSSIALDSSPQTDEILGSSQSSAIFIEEEPRYSPFSSSPPCAQPLAPSENTPEFSHRRPLNVSSRFSYAVAVEVPLPESIEEPAGSSSFNPILINAESDAEMDQTDVEYQDADEDMDTDMDEGYIMYLPEGNDEDPDYTESSNPSTPSSTPDEDTDDE